MFLVLSLLLLISTIVAGVIAKPANKNVRGVLALIVIICASIGSFTLGRRLERSIMETNFSSGPQRAFSYVFHDVVKNMEDQNFMKAESQIQSIEEMWPKMEFFRREAGLNRISWNQAVDTITNVQPSDDGNADEPLGAEGTQ